MIPSRPYIAVTATLCLLLAFLWTRMEPAPTREPMEFVGAQTCRGCHPQAYADWTGSHHDLAMQEANELTVLGNFADTTFEEAGTTFRFFRRDGGYWVNTPGPDGIARDFEIAYTFGVAPLQQYLIRFPGGRMQCLTIAWDTRAHRWFSLRPESPAATDDWLHWTGGAQTWNAMCAECHSTNLEKAYDLTTDTYATTWAEIDVSCEACHGGGARHVAWAHRPDRRTPHYGLVAPARGATAHQEVELCARCHARRVALDDLGQGHGQDLLDHIVPALPSEEAYFPDGQMKEEVYEWGSFVQSRMFQRGVRCTDCHDPHRGTLYVEGNALCSRCHTAGWYDTPSHHFHPPLANGDRNPGAACTACHMPERVYMGIDRRSDHSLRVPRPDLAENSGSPSACAQCHESDAWAAAALAQRLPLPRPSPPSSALAAARRGFHDDAEELARVARDASVPAAVRASAVALLSRAPDAHARAAAAAALHDDESLVRHAALGVSSLLAPNEREIQVVPLLSDPVRAVRQEAARVLAPRAADLARADGDLLREVLASTEESLRRQADVPGGNLALSNFYVALGRDAEAEAALRRAIVQDSRFTPALVNLAHLLSRSGRNEEAEQRLRAAIDQAPALFEARYDLALLLAESGRLDEAAAHMTQAVTLAPGFARAHYNLGLLERDRGHMAQATASLTRALALDPSNPDFAVAAEDLRRHRAPVPPRARGDSAQVP